MTSLADNMQDHGSAAFQEVARFFDKYRRATTLMKVAAHDYAAARCVLLNGMFEGLVLGAQAIEKTLKAYLILDDPQRPVKKLQHSLPQLLAEADSIFPHLELKRFTPMAESFRRHYQARYPDNADASANKSTVEIRALDELMIFLSENIPCPHNVKYRAGIYPLITFSLSPSGTVTPWERWIKEDNQSLQPLLDRINAEHSQVLAVLHPNK